MRVVRVSLLVPAVIRPGVAAAGAGGASGAGGAGRVVAVTAVAAETAVGLALVQSASIDHLIARRVPGRVVVHRLAVLVVAEQPVGRLRVRVRVLAAHLGVERRRDVGLTLQTVVVAAVLLLRRQVLILVVAGLAVARTLLAAPVLARVAMQGSQHRHALVGVLLEPRDLCSRQGRHEVR